NTAAEARYAQNIFSVTRQVRYSQIANRRALDLVLFINGLPIATFELKNRTTKQTVEDAIQQYKRDRDPRETLFQFGRCVVHFAVDDQEVWMCTHLKGRDSWFLPFNKGYDQGAGNPPNPDGLKTDYLWKDILHRDSLADILENYAQIVAEKRDGSRKKTRKQIFPRYHQLDVVRKLLADVAAHGPGRRYLIQHSTGSGKSNSIAWLVHQLVGLSAAQDEQRAGRTIFDSVIVVTDRRVLDRQIHQTIKHFTQVSAVLGHADRSADLRDFLAGGKKIIITTVQKFPYILDQIGSQHIGRNFAIVIDEAHSSQGGRTTAQMHMALSGAQSTENESKDLEDRINRIIAARKMLPNASYFAFTATPKNKTLELFGEPFLRPDGSTGPRPFHVYSMKQAIQEGFIRDVLQNYTPVATYFRLVKTIADDPEFDRKKAERKLRYYVAGNRYAIEQKAHIMVEHFHNHVRHKIGGQARAMVVTSGVRQAIEYFYAFRRILKDRNSPWQAIVAFSGERTYNGQKVSEATLNGFPSKQIPEKFRQKPYRFLIVAEKFQTGFDEPLLHTMYVDKVLGDIQAVQTLSRLNRAHPQKRDTFVLDFVNDTDTIQNAFDKYYRTTILSQNTDPNKLHDLKRTLDEYQVYTWQQVETFVERYLNAAPRPQLDPILDACVDRYVEDLDEDEQVDFK
ncbi:MAG: type I restriction endonuclease subunit R, partial [Gammaproteobacteria bacterium]